MSSELHSLSACAIFECQTHAGVKCSKRLVLFHLARRQFRLVHVEDGYLVGLSFRHSVFLRVFLDSDMAPTAQANRIDPADPAPLSNILTKLEGFTLLQRDACAFKEGVDFPSSRLVISQRLANTVAMRLDLQLHIVFVRAAGFRSGADTTLEVSHAEDVIPLWEKVGNVV